ncbi:MAG TPA: DUF192 domain-containing protein [Chloroflexia bacterium]|nr:DUF192 domain-containing protein [Chloroflexia bacterium]
MSDTPFHDVARSRMARNPLLWVLLLISLLTLLLYGCDVGNSMNSVPTGTSAEAQAATIVPTQSAPTASPTIWIPPTALVGTPIPGAQATLTAAPQLQTGVLTITNKKGEKVNMTVEIADTEASRSLGLMHRSYMDPDAGMLFVWPEEIQGGFWMFNTILPLSIAFISADGTILNIQDMQPLDTNTVGPASAYRYALETNQGFFRAHEITEGDKVTLPGDQAAVIPGMPNCCCPESAALP